MSSVVVRFLTLPASKCFFRRDTAPLLRDTCEAYHRDAETDTKGTKDTGGGLLPCIHGIRGAGVELRGSGRTLHFLYKLKTGMADGRGVR